MASCSRTLRLARIASPLRSSVGGGGASSTSVHRPLASAAGSGSLHPAASPSVPAGARPFAKQRPVASSLRDSSPNRNRNNRPPPWDWEWGPPMLHDDGDSASTEGCDYEHWLVIMEPPPGDARDPDVPREELIDSYIKTLSKVVGSEEKARQKIYSVSTRHYFAFGALVSQEMSYKLKELPNVRWVLPDSYPDIENKDYGGEPFINGEAAPYDPKYHEEWVRMTGTARCRHNDRPRISRNMQNFRNRDVPPRQELNTPSPCQNPTPPPHAPSMHHGQGNMPLSTPQNDGAPPVYQQGRALGQI